MTGVFTSAVAVGYTVMSISFDSVATYADVWTDKWCTETRVGSDGDGWLEQLEADAVCRQTSSQASVKPAEEAWKTSLTAASSRMSTCTLQQELFLACCAVIVGSVCVTDSVVRQVPCRA